MSARTQEALIAWGKQKQSALGTKNADAELWRLFRTDQELADPQLSTETDAPFIGKGHEFVENVFLTAWDVAFRMEKMISSQVMAWGSGFVLGTSVKTGVGPFVYTSVPAVPETDTIDLPAFSVIEQMRPGGSAVFDEAKIGCCLESMINTIEQGPGLQNSRVEFEVRGTGKVTDPSGSVIPARTPENILSSGSLAATILGTDYVANKQFIELRWGFRNNILADPGYFPGSGTQDGAAIRGRMQYGVREPILELVARMDDTSGELALLKNQNTGTAVISQVFDANEQYTVTFHKISVASVERVDRDGLAAQRIVYALQQDAVNGLMTVATTTAVDNIAQ